MHAVCGAAMFAVFGRGLGAPSLLISSLSFFGHSRPKKASHSLRSDGAAQEHLQQPHSFDSDKKKKTEGRSLAASICCGFVLNTGDAEFTKGETHHVRFGMSD